MLPLVSERFERTLCRVLFVALCLLPTCGVAGWTYYQRLPGHRAACQQTLARQLGLSVQLGAVEHTRPGALRLNAVELRDPETNELIARAATIEATRHGDDWWLTLTQPEIALGGCRSLGELLERRMRWPTDARPGQLHVSAGQAQVIAGTKRWPIEQLAGTLIPSPERVEARLAFRWQGAAAVQPAALKLVRDRARAEPTTLVDLQTGGVPFPAALLGPWIDCPGWLGHESTLLGRATVECGRQIQRWTVRGRLEGVELVQLVNEHFAHELTGDAQIELDVEGYGSRVLRASGLLAAQRGTIGRPLMAALGSELEMTAAQLPPAMGEHLRYEELRLRYALDEHGSLTLRGESRYAEGALLVDANGVLLREPPTIQDSEGLIRVLAARPGARQAPVPLRTAQLMQILPSRRDAAARPASSPLPR